LVELAEERQRILTAFPGLRDYVLHPWASEPLRKRLIREKSSSRTLAPRLGRRQRSW